LKKYGLRIEELRMVPSSGGAFEITVDGRRVWSKKQSKTFPSPGQIVDALSA
jgi:selT/selW/selH-like putative selenoprotein